MRIFYMILVICVFLYADNFKSITILKLNKPTFKVHKEDEDKEYYVNAVRESCNTQIVKDFQEEHIINFFKKAKEYYEDSGIGVEAAYCTFPCRITGIIKLDSIIYDFELNEGGYAKLKNKDEKRDFGDEQRYGECGI
ncbi:hypothetical protein CQA53_10485 [Helicobacter didelphidarum]|uniref:Uncharacterized protein n=1 Tax=Helicobacter didelphidarum TaxID=2040648 RepID=A0A3D8I7U4_9HELI|nr:hypothetical protein [Helicobacter didelphidarum]RDU61198.1 hypothetical protein CQA53_10485 [Helicobacter didelphidarum]